jgi:hypothetical protein
MSIAVLVTNMRNFPLSRGAVAGILKGYSGLSAAVYTAIYTGALHSSAANLLLFLTLGVATVYLLAMYFVRPCEPSLVENSSERVHFLFVQISSALLGVYLVAATTLDSFCDYYPRFELFAGGDHGCQKRTARCPPTVC